MLVDREGDIDLAGLTGLNDLKLIKRLPGGLGNRTFLVDQSGLKRVLRIEGQSSKLSSINRYRENAAWRAAAKENLAPALVYSDVAEGIFLSDYLPGTCFNGEKTADIESLAARLSTLHTLRVDLPVVDLLAQAESYHGALSQHRSPQLNRVEQWRRRVSGLLEIWRESHRPVALCHNDLVNANILKSERTLYFIDWEYSGLGDPCFDLAVVVEENAFDENQTEQFLAAWGEVHVRSDSKLQSARVLYRYLCLQWYMLIGNGGDEADAQMCAAIGEQEQALSRLLERNT